MFTKEQQKAIDYDSGNVLVSASAGSGKTSVMIERLTRLVVSGKAKVNEILAVTFTEASASDMKEKLKKALTIKVNESLENVENQQKEQLFELENQLNEIRTSDISTIDSFCSRLVRTNFFEIGIAPDYDIADNNKTEILKDEAINNVFKEEYKRGGKFLTIVDQFSSKRNDNNLKKIILDFYNFLSSEANEEKTIEKYKSMTFDYIESLIFDIIGKKLYSIKSRLEVCLADCGAYVLPKTMEFATALKTNVESVLNSQTTYSIFDTNVSSGRISFDSTKDEFVKDIQDRIRIIKNDFCDLVKELGGFFTTRENDKKTFSLSTETASFLCDLTLKFKSEFDRLKREENLLDFADLEHFALKILSNPTALENIKSKYKFIFVDEYQDINNTQEEIISLLSSENCFMVGDEKQSIYGFRGCRPEFFSEKFKRFEENNGNCVKLNNNFRSAENVIKMVNNVFSFCMTKESYGISYQSEASLIYGGGYNDYLGRANLHILQRTKTQRQKEEPRIYNVKDEALKEEIDDDNLTVSLLSKIINDELNSEYYDVREGKIKKVTKKDIVILTRNSKGTYIDGIVKGLIRHGIDVSAQNEEDICAYPEIQNAINFLRLIDCFYQDIPLLSSIKGVFCNCQENELADIVDFYKEKLASCDSQKRYDFCFSDAFAYYVENAKGELRERLITFTKYVEKIRFVSDFKLAGEILEEVEKDFSIFAYLYAEKNGDIKVKRLQRLINFCHDNELSIQTLLKLVDSGDKKITLNNGGNENSVSIMTIHSSKGLEFPVVICCGLEKNFNTEDIKKEVIFDRDLGIVTKSYDLENRTAQDTIFKYLAKERFKSRTEKEELRLFYVALTRATYSLHIVANVQNDKRKEVFDGASKFFDYIPNSINATYYSEEDMQFINQKQEIRKVIISQENKTEIEQLKKRFSFCYPFKADTTMPLKTSVTEINAMAKDIEPTLITELFSESEDNTDTERGIIAHKIMQYFDFGGDNFESQIKKMLDNNLFTQKELDKVDLEKIKSVVTSSYFVNMKGQNLYREQPFIFSVDAKDIFSDIESSQKILVQGVIDLLIINGSTAEIIDYKYSNKTSERLKKDYQKQLDIYAKAVEEILNLEVTSKKIVSLLNGSITELTK